MAEEEIKIRGRDNTVMAGKSNVYVDNQTGAKVKAYTVDPHHHSPSSTQPDVKPRVDVDGNRTVVMYGESNLSITASGNKDRSSPGDVSHGVKTHATAEGTRGTTMRDPGGTTTTEPEVTTTRDRRETHVTDESGDLVKVKENTVSKIHFRQEVEGNLVQIGNCCTIVDIRIDDHAMDRLERGGELTVRSSGGTRIKFTWEPSKYQETFKSYIHFKVKEAFDNIYEFLLAGFKEDNFCYSRKMVQELFEEYNGRIQMIFSGSIVFEVSHDSLQSLETMESRPGPLINMFEDFVFQTTKSKVEVEVFFERVPASEPMPLPRHAPSRTAEAARTPAQEDDELYCLSDADKQDCTLPATEPDQSLQASQIKSILDKVKSIQKHVREVYKEGATAQAKIHTPSTSVVPDKDLIGKRSEFRPGPMPAIAAHCQAHRPANPLVQTQPSAESTKASLTHTGAQKEGSSQYQSTATSVRGSEFDSGKTRHQSSVGPTRASPVADVTDPHPTGASRPHHSTAHEHGSATQSATSTGGAKPKVKGASTDKLMTLARSALQHYSEEDLRKIEKSAQSALEDDLSPRAQSLGTILCLDCSQSMAGDAFRQMMEIAESFINGVEDVAENDNVEENVAVVSVSGRARVVQQLTNDYSKVRDAFEKLKPEGRSPLFEMLIVALAAIQGKGGVIKVHNHRIRPRIVVITDGKLTDEKQDGGADIQSHSAKVNIIRLVSELGSKKHKTTPSPIVWVPVGDSDRDLLNSLAKLGNGKVVEAEDLPKLIRYYKIQDSIGKIYDCVRDNIDEYPDVQQALKDVAQGIIGDVNPSDIEDIVAAVRDKLSSEKVDTKPDDFDNVCVNPELPALGTRVMRDCRWQDQRSQDVGTIINHDENENWVWVLWDSGNISRQRYDLNGAFDVVPVDGHPRIPESEQILQLGVRVKRGRGWESKNDDGGEGNTGVVIRTRGDQEVKVQWTNGRIRTHKFGLDGVYELEICDPQVHKKPRQTGGEWMFPGPSQHRGLGSAPVEEEDPRPSVWRWNDGHQWRLYPDDMQVKIQQEYNRKKDGTCLVKKRDGSYRIYFKSMQEKSLEENTRHDVQRLHVDEGGLASLKTEESFLD